MGIPISIDIRDPADFAVAVRDAFTGLIDADRRFSSYRTDSEIASVNEGIILPADYSDDLREVLAIAASFQRTSGGIFSVRIPGRGLDTNGIVKGWAVQRAANQLERAGAKNFCLNAGGDVVVRGEPRPGSAWNVGIRSPQDARSMLAVLSVTDRAVATSGAYERGEHILDGRTGVPAREMASVSVVALDLTTADVLATTIFAMGANGPQWAAQNYDCAVLAVTTAGDLIDAGDVPLAAAQ